MSDNIASKESKKKSVGIQLISQVSGGLVAILQVRAAWNAEKNAPETWPGACQVTAHGKLEAGEDFMQGLLREIKEELGDEIAIAVTKIKESGQLKELVNLETEDKHTITYGAIVKEDVLKMLTIRERKPSFGGFKLIKRDDVNKIVDIQTIDKKTGVTDENVIAMFPDEKEAVRLAFEKLN